MGEITRYYYVDEYTDEIVPCDCTLQGWADWLSKPDPDWNRPEKAEDGEEFMCSTMDVYPDLVVVDDGDGPTFDPPPADATMFFMRYGRGMGWSAESQGDTVEQCLEWDEDRPAYIAPTKNGPRLRVRYVETPTGPRMVIVGAVQ